MKRHPAFQDLSRDHYVALNRSLQVARAVDGHPSAWSFPEAFAAFRMLWERDGLQAHFREEEADLLPALRAGGATELADRMVREHDGLRARFAALAKDHPQHAADTARHLTAHARWEEEVVFPWLQEHLGEAALAELLRKSQAFRAANGLPVQPPRP